jgi:hypothetical protein
VIYIREIFRVFSFFTIQEQTSPLLLSKFAIFYHFTLTTKEKPKHVVISHGTFSQTAAEAGANLFLKRLFLRSQLRFKQKFVDINMDKK